MNFLNYLFADRKINRVVLFLFVGFAVFYGLMNAQYLIYIAEHATVIGPHSPFNTQEFPLNLFNFDPSMYYGTGNASIIHPLISYLTAVLGAGAKLLGGNWFFLVLQSFLNAGSVVLVFLFLSRKTRELTVPLLMTLLFGFSSYLIFTAFIPDSYPYAQFVILLSVVYMQYARERNEVRYMPNALLTTVNFGLTSTNIAPFAAGLFFNMQAWRNREGWKKLFGIAALAAVLIALLTVIQFFVFERSWVSNWLLGIQNGGLGYAAPFKFAAHQAALNLLVINPMLTPQVHMLNPNMVAIVTDLAVPNPLYTQLPGLFIVLLALLGFIFGIRERETWTLIPYILFAFLLHIVVGFGLAVFEYDMYLYAGHYLFAFFLLAGGFVIKLRKGLVKQIAIGLLALCVLIMAGNNIYRHGEALSTIKQSYEQLEQASVQ